MADCGADGAARGSPWSGRQRGGARGRAPRADRGGGGGDRHGEELRDRFLGTARQRARALMQPRPIRGPERSGVGRARRDCVRSEARAAAAARRSRCVHRPAATVHARRSASPRHGRPCPSRRPA